jgi:hypothetical protein
MQNANTQTREGARLARTAPSSPTNVSITRTQNRNAADHPARVSHVSENGTLVHHSVPCHRIELPPMVRRLGPNCLPEFYLPMHKYAHHVRDIFEAAKLDTADVQVSRDHLPCIISVLPPPRLGTATP